MQEHRKHILNKKLSNEEGRSVSFCGEGGLNMMFHFTDVDHAVRHRQNRGRMLPCVKCKNEVIRELNNKE